LNNNVRFSCKKCNFEKLEQLGTKKRESCIKLNPKKERFGHSRTKERGQAVSKPKITNAYVKETM